MTSTQRTGLALALTAVGRSVSRLAPMTHAEAEEVRTECPRDLGCDGGGQAPTGYYYAPTIDSSKPYDHTYFSGEAG
ncbi:hypothetical protein [Streptomyces sp. NPDC048560]|uniref:hypothetical protein n=1 Tax=Streptomyces sp. NPDC048560 TaxID=3155488 RepID=UPI00342EC070